jgi:hypothetical protein
MTGNPTKTSEMSQLGRVLRAVPATPCSRVETELRTHLALLSVPDEIIGLGMCSTKLDAARDRLHQTRALRRSYFLMFMRCGSI